MDISQFCGDDGTAFANGATPHGLENQFLFDGKPNEDFVEGAL
jgi:hypothetical protein